MAPLVPALYCYLHATLASSTFNVYRTAWNLIVLFVCTVMFHHYRCINTFVLFNVGRRLSYKYVKDYLSRIQFCSNITGLTEKVSEMCQLFYVLRDIRKVKGSSLICHRRPALTLLTTGLFRAPQNRGREADWDPLHNLPISL